LAKRLQPARAREFEVVSEKNEWRIEGKRLDVIRVDSLNRDVYDILWRVFH